MRRLVWCGVFACFICLQISCGGKPVGEKPPPVHNLSRGELVAMHDQYFQKMGLKAQAQAEMHKVVEGFYDKITTQGQPLVRTKEKKFASKEEWLQTHQKYFQALGISEGTRGELHKAMAVLYDKMQTDPKEELVVAVRQMMEKFKGMPPCCSEDSLERAVK